MNAAAIAGGPAWAHAAFWAMLAGSGLIVGSVAASIARPTHGNVARVMAFGAGALLGIVSAELALSAQDKSGILRTTIVLLSGALAFSLVNVMLARAGAQNRKRCGECMPQESEAETPGSGKAIAVGTMIDALPEGLVLGIAIGQSLAAPAPVVAAFFLANVPESLSASAGMSHAGRSTHYILSVWCAAIVVSLVGAVLGAMVFARTSTATAGLLEALSAGVILAMSVETMIPEAFDNAPLFSGTIAVLGFAAIATIV